MLIVTTGDRELEPIMRENIRRCEAFGYRTLVYDIGDLGWGTPFHVEPSEVRHPDLDKVFGVSATFKPRMLAEAMKACEPDEWLAWIDGDAVVMRELADPLFVDADVAVTLREPEMVGKSGHPFTDYLNAGVVFICNNDNGRQFLARWAWFCGYYPSDQPALNEAVGCWRPWSDEDWRVSYGRTHWCGGIRVHILPASEWNFSDFNRPPPSDVRVLHFKAGWRKLMGERWRNYLGRAA